MSRVLFCERMGGIDTIISVSQIGERTLKDVEYETLKEAVGGYIEVLSLGRLTTGRDLEMVINEEGKLQSLPRNPEATRIFQKVFEGTEDWIAGNAVYLVSEPHPDDGRRYLPLTDAEWEEVKSVGFQTLPDFYDAEFNRGE